MDIAANLDLIDFEAGSRVAGHGFYYLKNDAVMLEMALVQFALSKLREEGFTLYTTPDLARGSVLEGIGFNPRGDETQIYSVADTDLSLVATAEITLGGAMQGQTLDIADLPLKCAGLSHCFRTEAGAYGRKTRGNLPCASVYKGGNVCVYGTGQCPIRCDASGNCPHRRRYFSGPWHSLPTD